MLALYILLAACTPVPATDWTGFWSQLQETPSLDSMNALDINELAQQQFCRNLEKNVSEQLEQNGIQADVDVCADMDAENAEVELERVTIQLRNAEQLTKAQSILREYLGSDTPVEYSAVKDGTP